jgi:hypothetical protein
MSCDHSSYDTAIIDLIQCLSPTVALGDYATARETETECGKSLKQDHPELTAGKSKSKGHRHEVRSRIIPDSTQTNPEYVWGDEGPIND